MTLVAACNLIHSIVLIADCRVSYQSTDAVDDNLQKLYYIYPGLFLGFSGPLAGAYEVLSALRQHFFRYKKTNISLPNIKRDCERVIRRSYRNIENPKSRENLMFVIAAVDLQRKAKITTTNEKGERVIKPFNLVPEMSITAYKPSSRKSTELIKTDGRETQVLGVIDKQREYIEGKIKEIMGDNPIFNLAYAGIMARIFMSYLRDEHTIGGLFNAVVITADGHDWLGYSDDNISLDIVDGQYVQKNNSTGQIVRLKNIWDWWNARGSPGNAGEFDHYFK